MEARLVVRANASGRIDLRQLLERDLDTAHRIARAILLDDQDAEDALQDACLAAWRKRSSLRDPDRFSSWFQRIVINVCRDRLRRRRRERVRAISLRAAAEGGAPSAPFTNFRLDDAVDRLDLDHRLVVLLRYWLDLPLDEIAQRLGIPVGTVKSRLHVALRRIRNQMEATDERLGA